MLRTACFTFAVAALVLAAAGPAAADPAKKSAAELLPASTVVYVEVNQAGRLIDTLLDHPVLQQLQQQPDFQKALESPDVEELQLAVKAVEEKLGTPWRKAISTLSGEGIYLGVELGTQGVVVLVRSQDEALLAKTRDTFVDLVREKTANNNQQDPIQVADYHGVTTYQIKDAYYATLGPWFVITNKSRVGQMIIDNALEADRPSLASDKQFQTALKQKQDGAQMWGYADLTIVRATGIAKSVLNKKSDNPAAELLFGGLLAAAPHAPFATFEAKATDNRLALSTAIPHNPKQIGKAREYYFGPEGKGAAPPLLEVKDTIFTLSTYRDFGLMWKQAPELFDDNVNAKFAEAESGLATIFSGRSFPDDILANLEPGMQLVVARQTFAKDDITPAIPLPATAVVFTMKKPEETARQFKITYQSLIGFLNVAGGMNNLEALEQDTEKLGKITLVSAKYLPPQKPEERASAGIHHNASPTVAFVGEKFILSSTRSLALEIAEQFAKASPPASAGVNTQLKLHGAALVASLADNRAQLVAQNQQDKGHSAAEAEKEIDLLMQLLAGLGEMSLSLTTTGETLRLSWELQLAK